MKRVIAIIISLVIMLPIMADAQIKKTGTYKSETISSARMGIVSLRHDKSYYLAIRTTNQFDDAMILELGKTKESAIQSLSDLLDILENLQGKETQYIDNGYGKQFRLHKELNALHIHADGYAGVGGITKAELKKFIKAL